MVIIARHLATKGLLEAFAQQVRLVRGRLGKYEPIDFLALLIGYAISGERTLSDFFECVAPFETAFMALFGRRDLPHRSSLSRFLADVDHPCLEAFRTLFQQYSFIDGWTKDALGGVWDRQGRRYVVFDLDATRQAAASSSTAVRSCVACCKTPTRVRSVHPATKGVSEVKWYNGLVPLQARAMVTSAVNLLRLYKLSRPRFSHYALTAEMALVRLDGQYGDAVVIAQIILAGVHGVPRGRGYQLLEHPQIQQALAHPPTTSVTCMNTGEIVELFDGGWLELEEGLPRVRVIVARHPVHPDKPVRVGKRMDEWVYELFITTLDADGFLVEDVLDLYHGRGAFEGVLADEDVEEDPDRWCSYTECGQELWQIACQWVWNLRLSLGHAMQGSELREIEWAPPKESPPLLLTVEDPPQEYGPWQWAAAFGRATGRFGAEAFVLQENGTLRCPAGASLWLSEVRQENAFTQRAVYLAYQTDCQRCSLREECLAKGAKGNRARRVSAVRRLLPPPAEVSRKPVMLGSMRWVDVAGRVLRRSWMTHWRSQYVEVLALVEVPKSVSPPPRPPRALRSHHRWSWQDRLARNACWGPPQLRITVAGVPAFLASN